MGSISQVRKRSGALDRYDEAKLERSILRAVRDAGQENESLARDLADVVTKYLLNHFDKRGVPTSDEIRELVRKVLVETGYPQVADCYVRFRKAGGAPADLFPQDLIVIAGATRDETQRWQRERIAQALVREADLDEATAARVAARVEQRILALKLRQVSTALVRELVNQELVQEGRPVPLERQRVLGIPKADLREMLTRGGAETADPDALCTTLGELTLRQFSLQEVFSREVAAAHLEGRIHIHGLENPLKMYWGTFESSAILPEPGGLPDLRLTRTRSRFAEGLEITGIRTDALPQVVAEVSRACADRAWPRVVIHAAFAAGDDPAPLFRALDQSSTAPLRLNVTTPAAGEAAKALAHRAIQRGGVLFNLRGAGSRFSEGLPVVAQAVSINLPQAVARAGSTDGSLREVEEAFEIAVAAHEQKRRSGVTAPARYSIALQGVAEAARLATSGRRLGRDEEALLWSMQVLGFAQGLAREATLRAGLQVGLDDVLSHRAADRFARIDGELFPAIASGSYSPGFHVPAGVPPLARLAVEARLGAFVESSVALVPREDRPNVSTEELIRLIEEGSRDGRLRRLLVL